MKSTDSTRMCRFDLEQQILNCWNIIDDLDLLEELVLEKEASMDEIANFVLGLKAVYKQKFEKCFNTFEQCCYTKQI